jgi:hypothetical protein
MPPRSTKCLLIARLRNPEALPNLSVEDWNVLIPVLRRDRLLSHLGNVAGQAGVFNGLPSTVQDLCTGSLVRVQHMRRQSLYIAEEISQRLAAQGIQVALLKGAAYAAAGYRFADGRMYSDLDILVKAEDLAAAEAVLRRDGWQPDELDAADERYYREWMHELPPFKHRTVPLELDIHHNLAPPVSRIRLDMTPFWRDAVTLQPRGLTVLSSAHQLIHSALHLFFNDELRGGLRELLDIHGLCELGHATPGFWGEVRTVGRSQPALAQTLFYALDTARRLLGSPVDSQTLEALRPPQLGTARLAVMRWLFDRALLEDAGFGTSLAKHALFVRSHWLRMPLRLLAPHLGRKAWLGLAAAIRRA